MRGLVAKSLRRAVLQHLEQEGTPAKSELVGVRVKRGASRMRKLRLRRNQRVQELMACHGLTREAAEAIVPEVADYAIQAVGIGARAMYQELKKRYYLWRKDALR